VILRSPGGDPLRVIGTHEDISRRKSFEASMRSGETVLRTIFSSGTDGVVVLNADRRISRANPALYELFSLGAEDVLGVAQSHFESILQEKCALQPLDESDEEPVAHGALRTKYVMKTPRQRYIQRERIPIEQEGIQEILYFRDISAETMIDQMKSEFLSTAAHELRTPISIILGYTELLKTKPFDPETRQQMLERVHAQSSGILHLLNELLDLTRIESRMGKVFQFRMASLEDLLRDIAGGFIHYRDQRRVVLGSLPELPPLRMDPDKLNQAILNCLSNAFKFSEEGSEVALEAERIVRDGRDEVEIRIRDHGIGMSSEQAARAFDKFYRVDSSGKIPGSGLGLCLVKEIVEAHGGSVLLQSQLGEGTTIRLYLPLPMEDA
jgi:signal transduction histidine kinase